MKEKINKILRQLLKEIEELPTIHPTLDFENDTCLNKKQVIELINKYIK